MSRLLWVGSGTSNHICAWRNRFVEQCKLFKQLGYKQLLGWSPKAMLISFIFVGFLQFLSDLPSQVAADVPIFFIVY